MNVNFFWSNPVSAEDTLQSWRNQKPQLSELQKFAIMSHVLAGHTVNFYTYHHEVSGLSKHRQINMYDAGSYYSADFAFYVLRSGHSIAHVSDLVRILASMDNSGVVADLDLTALRPYPELDEFFSSIPARTTGGMALKFGPNNPELHVATGYWDGKALSSFPVKVGPKTYRHFAVLVQKIRSTLQAKPMGGTKGWNFIMWGLKDILRETNSPVLPPMAFGPVPSWKTNGCYSLEYPVKLDGETILFGYPMPSIDEIINNSYGVLHWFESYYKNKPSYTGYKFWENLKDGCLLSREAEHIFGKNWRNDLINL